jgi:hypothetical protein
MKGKVKVPSKDRSKTSLNIERSPSSTPGNKFGNVVGWIGTFLMLAFREWHSSEDECAFRDL